MDRKALERKRANLRIEKKLRDEGGFDYPTGEVRRKEVDDVTEGLPCDRIFRCDVAAFPYAALPPLRTMTSALVTSSRHRATVAGCCDAAGASKLPLLVVGGKKERRKMKSRFSDDEVYYRYRKGSRLDSTVFAEWFRACVAPRVRRRDGGKVVVFVEDLYLSDELRSCDDCVVVKPLPSASKNLIASLAPFYRKHILREALSRGESVNKTACGMSLVGAVSVLAAWWRSLSPAQVRDCWKEKEDELSRFELERPASLPPPSTAEDLGNDQGTGDVANCKEASDVKKKKELMSDAEALGKIDELVTWCEARFHDDDVGVSAALARIRQLAANERVVAKTPPSASSEAPLAENLSARTIQNMLRQ